MADLAGGRLQTGVAVFAGDMAIPSGAIWQSRAVGGLAVQLVTAVAVDTVHAPFAEMHIARESFILAQVFVAHPAAVTGGAGTGHRRGLRMNRWPSNKPAAHAGRLAHVAIAAGCVALGAVITKHFFAAAGVIFGALRGIERRPVALLCGVQAVGIHIGYVGMAIGARIRVALAGAGDQALMSGILIRRLHASVTVGAGNVTVNGLRERSRH